MSGAVPPGAALRRFDALIALLDDFPEDSDAVLAGRSAEREADLRAVAEAAVAAGGEGLLSPHGAALDARPLRPWRFATAALDAEAWAADGFCVLSGVLDAAALAEARAAAEAIIEAAFASSGMASRAAWQARVTQLPDPAVWEPRLGALERSPALRAAAAAALGVPAARCAWAHLVFKPPGEARPLPWHTDRPTWPLPEGVEGVAAWISLDPLQATSGGLRYAPGSHRDGADLVDPVVPQVSAGDAILHHADVLHASGANRSGAWRRAWIGVFVADAAEPTPRPPADPRR
jgi:ectoine hydroxylase-related dioxygenase (phytanoyl-CoA dioxygenase family)